MTKQLPMTTALIKLDQNLPAFPIERFTVSRRFGKFVGPNLIIQGARGDSILFSKVTGLKIKDDLFLFSDEKMTRQCIRIHPRYAMELGKTYDVRDFSSGAADEIGSIYRPRNPTSPWSMLDLEDNSVGQIVEKNTRLSLVQRVVKATSVLVNQQFQLIIHGRICASIERKATFKEQLVTCVVEDIRDEQERRLFFVAAILLGLAEGKRKR